MGEIQKQQQTTNNIQYNTSRQRLVPFIIDEALSSLKVVKMWQSSQLSSYYIAQKPQMLPE